VFQTFHGHVTDYILVWTVISTLWCLLSVDILCVIAFNFDKNEEKDLPKTIAKTDKTTPKPQ